MIYAVLCALLLFMTGHARAWTEPQAQAAQATVAGACSATVAGAFSASDLEPTLITPAPRQLAVAPENMEGDAGGRSSGRRRSSGQERGVHSDRRRRVVAPLVGAGERLEAEEVQDAAATLAAAWPHGRPAALPHAHACQTAREQRVYLPCIDKCHSPPCAYMHTKLR